MHRAFKINVNKRLFNFSRLQLYSFSTAVELSVPQQVINCTGYSNLDNIRDVSKLAEMAKTIYHTSQQLDETNANELHSILKQVEIFDDYDGNEINNNNDDNEYQLTNIQTKMINQLINDQNANPNEIMNAFYMVDLGDIIRKYREWRYLLPNIQPYYAIKCNPDPLIIKLLNYLGCSFDCASKHEFDTLIANGVNVSDNHRVIFSHPCKHPLHLKYASDIGISLCTFDNEYEIDKISKYHPSSQTLLRIQVDDSQSVCKFNEKYGYNIDNVSDIYNIFELCHKSSISLNGIMFHVGSGCSDSNVYETAIEKCCTLFDIGYNKYGIDNNIMNILDLGGGFPGNNEKNTNNITFNEIANVINKSLKYYFDDKNKYKLSYIAEPGRYFVSKSHILICDIIAKKRINFDGINKFMYYINEGMYGSFNCMYYDHAEPTIIPYDNGSNNNNDNQLYKSTIFGPTCDSMDKMYDDYLLRELNISDKLVIPNFGAYTSTGSSGFNGFQKSKSRYVMTL